MAKKKLSTKVYELMCKGEANHIEGYRKVQDRYLVSNTGIVYDRIDKKLIKSKVDKKGFERVILENIDDTRSPIMVKNLIRHTFSK